MAPPRFVLKKFSFSRAKLFAVFIFISILFSSNQVVAMSMIGFKICLASESSGVVTLDGAPVEGATVKRYVKSSNNEKEFTHETTTDKNGNFSFSSLYIRSLLPLWITIQPVTHQEVTITHNGQEYLAWNLTKMNWDLNGEINSFLAQREEQTLPFSTSCELSNPTSAVKLKESNQSYTGICKINGAEVTRSVLTGE